MGVSVKCAAVNEGVPLIPLTTDQIKQDQRNDPTVGPVIQYKLAATKPSGPELRRLGTQ